MKTPSSLRLILATLILGAAVSAQALVWEDFESSDTNWTTKIFNGNLLAEGTISDDFASSGTRSYRGKFKFPAIGGRAALSTQQGADMTGLTVLSFDVYNSSPLAFEGFMVFKTGAAWAWHESTKFQLKPGWNKDVKVTVVPVGGTGAGSVISTDHLEDVREVSLVFDTKVGGEGFLYLDNVRLEGPDPSRFIKTDVEVSGTEVLLAGFEGTASPFTADTYSGSSAIGVEQVPVKTTQGSHAGRFAFNSKVPDEKPSFTFESDMDLSAVTGARVDVYNPLADEADLTFTVNTGANWEYFESTLKNLKPGWNLNLTFPLQSKNFKCEKSGWRNSAAITDLKNTRKVSLAFLPHMVGPSFFLVDNFRLVASDGAKLAAMLRSAGAVEAPPLTGQDRLLEGFEGANLWVADKTSSGAVSLSVKSAKTTEGKNVLHCEFDMSGSRKNAFFGVEGTYDLQGAEAIKVDIYNPMKEPLAAEMSLTIGDRYVWFESRLIDLKPGWNSDVTFPLTTPSFKSEATQWRNKAVPGPLNKVKKIQIGVYSNNSLKGSVYLDNVRLTAPESYRPKTAKARAQKVVAGREVIFDPFQTASGGWIADQSAANNSFAVAVHYAKKEGAYGASLKFRTSVDNQSAAFHKDGQWDFSAVTGLRMDVYNPQDFAIEGAVAMKTGPDSVWHENQRFSLKPGWNKDITVSVDGPVWKTVESNWTNTDSLKNSDNVRQVVLLLYPNRKGQGEAFVSRIRTVERDLFGSLGQKGLGRFVGVAAKTVLTGRSAPQVKPLEFESGIVSSPSRFTGLYATSGTQSWQVPFVHHAGENTGLVISLPTPYKDLRSYQALQFDFYNPGPPRNLSVGFKNTTTSAWIGAADMTIASGWNRNMVLALDGTAFKSARIAWKIGETLAIRNQVDEIHFEVSGPPGHGTLYMDNLRVLGKGLPTAQDGTATQDLSIKFNPSDAVQFQMGGTFWKGNAGITGADGTKAQLDLRGGGQEFRLSTGAGLEGTDDPLKLLDGAKLGPNVLALSERATVKGASVQLLGFARNGSRPWSIGSEAGYVARLSQVFFEDYTVGAGVVGHRFGSIPGSNPLSADVESHIKTFHADVKGYVRSLGLNFEAEGAKSTYDEYQGASYGNPNTRNRAYRLYASMNAGPIKFSGSRNEKETGFFSPYSTDSSRGYFQNYGELNYQADRLPLVKMLRKKGRFLSDFLEGVKTYGQYYDWHVRDSTYSNYSLRAVVETNNYKTPLYVMAWWWWFNEGKDAGDLTLDNPSVSTRELQYTWNVSARYKLTSNLFLNVLARQGSTRHWQEDTGSGGLKWRFWGDTTLSGDISCVKKSGDRSGKFVNANAELVKRLKGNTYEIRATYGLPSFSGYWMEPMNPKTLQVWNATLIGRF